MTSQRKRHGAGFKARVALEALRGELAGAQLAAKRGVHQTVAGEWKRQAVEGLALEGLAAVSCGKEAAQEGAQVVRGRGGGAAREDRAARGGAGFSGGGLRPMSLERRRQVIEPGHPGLRIVRQCELLSASRSGFYHRPAGETAANLALMRLVDAQLLEAPQFLQAPWRGSRQMARRLWREGRGVGRKRVRRLMALAPACQRPRTTVPNPGHRVWPHLLRDGVVGQPGQVWRADLTSMPMRWGFLHLVAIMDGATGKVLSWCVSDTMGVEFCLEALARFGRPGVFDTDQGSQSTSPRFTGVLLAARVRVSMDGRGRWMGNVFVERPWRSPKHECVYSHAFEAGSGLRAGLARRIGYHDARRPHPTPAGRTPDEAYGTGGRQGQTGRKQRSWRPDDNQNHNQAYPGRRSVRTDGTTSYQRPWFLTRGIPCSRWLWFAARFSLRRSGMAVAITRAEPDAAGLRQAASRTKDADAARRMLALALVLDGRSRADAAQSCGMDRQTLRDWVHRFNEHGLAGLSDRKAPGPRRG